MFIFDLSNKKRGTLKTAPLVMKTYQITTKQVVHNGCLFTELYNVSEYVTIKINPMGGTFTSGEKEIFVKEKTEYYINLLNFVENNY